MCFSKTQKVTPPLRKHPLPLLLRHSFTLVLPSPPFFYSCGARNGLIGGLLFLLRSLRPLNEPLSLVLSLSLCLSPTHSLMYNRMCGDGRRSPQFMYAQKHCTHTPPPSPTLSIKHLPFSFFLSFPAYMYVFVKTANGALCSFLSLSLLFFL